MKQKLNELKQFLTWCWKNGPMRSPIVAAAFEGETKADLAVGILANVMLVGLAAYMSFHMTFQQCLMFLLAAMALKFCSGR